MGSKLKTLVAALALALVAGMAWAAETSVPGVWGVSFGDSFERADRILTETNGLRRLVDATALEGGREVLYGGDFFGHNCLVQVAFSDRGLWSFRFLFNRPLVPQNQQLTTEQREAKVRQEVLGGNYLQFLRMLTQKYGAPSREFSLADGEGRQWNLEGRSIVLAADGRSTSDHTTVLTYLDPRLR